MLSLMRTGIPCRAPRGPLALRSSSSARAMAMTSGLISITALIAGPCLSICSMRARYFLTRDSELYLPDFMPAWNSAIVASSRSNGLTLERAANGAGFDPALAKV